MIHPKFLRQFYYAIQNMRNPFLLKKKIGRAGVYGFFLVDGNQVILIVFLTELLIYKIVNSYLR